VLPKWKVSQVYWMLPTSSVGDAEYHFGYVLRLTKIAMLCVEKRPAYA
jgi:hypothetical protein